MRRYNHLHNLRFQIKIIIPIGISFYTLQLCGYCIDVYLKKYPAEINFFKYASFSLFFPIILQGPISRYDQLGKQLFNEKDTNNFYENLTFGTQLILWGFFKKLVIADRCALIVNLVFNNHANYFGLPVLVASILYTLQIYTDFSGCVDISRGVARIFGIDLIDNFRQPYFSTSIQDFWKRWHISLSSWLRDYVYIPLGGNRKGKTRKFFNLIFTFLVSGLWHGVGVHFIIWGLLQAILQIISTLTIGIREKACNILHIDRKRNAYKVFQIAITICLINFSWIFFRADGSMVAVQMVSSIFKDVNLSGLLEITDFTDLIIILLSTLLLFIVSTFKYEGRSVRKMIARCNLPVRWTIWIMLLFIVVIFGVYGPGYSSASFIYMNF